MKITFVCPECENLGVEYLSACLKQNGHEVNLVFDPLLFESYFLKSSLFKRAFSYRKNVVDKIIDSESDLVCFSVFSDYYLWACEIAEDVKRIRKELRIIFGGIHPSCVPERVIKEPFIDFVCVGEGEGSLVELANRLDHKDDYCYVENIWTKIDGKIVQNEPRPLVADLDALPLPDKELFLNEYNNFVRNTYTIITSRGCPNACTYCYNSYFKNLYRGKGHYLRRRSVENVINELLLAKQLFGIKRVAFFDDLFISDIGWLEEFEKKYKENINLPYFCHIHPSYINERSVALLESSRCATVTMGIQTMDANIRKQYLDRGESNEQIKLAIELLKKTRIFLYTNVIFGLPFQDEENMIEDIRFANKVRVDIPASNWLRYYPKTKIVEIAKGLSILDESKIEEIELSKKYVPYSIKGSTYNIIGARLRNMLLISHFLPASWVSFILKHKFYRFLPVANLRFYLELYIMARNKIIGQRKIPFAYLSVRDVLGYYWHYVFRKII